MNYVVKNKEKLLYAFAAGTYLIYFGPKIAFYSIADPMRIVIYGAPFPFASYYGSSLEWEYDVFGLALNLIVSTAIVFLLLSFFRTQENYRLMFRVFGVLICLPVFALFSWVWLSGFYELVHINFMEHLSKVIAAEKGSHWETVGKCVSMDFHRYLHGNQGFFCKS